MSFTIIFINPFLEFRIISALKNLVFLICNIFNLNFQNTRESRFLFFSCLNLKGIWVILRFFSYSKFFNYFSQWVFFRYKRWIFQFFRRQIFLSSEKPARQLVSIFFKILYKIRLQKHKLKVCNFLPSLFNLFETFWNQKNRKFELSVSSGRS